jgi:hypothetical protein
MTAYIGYNTCFETANAGGYLNSSALATGYNISNILDWKTHTGIKFASSGGSITAGPYPGAGPKFQSLGIIGKLENFLNISVLYRDDPADPWQQAILYTIPNGQNVVFLRWDDPGRFNYWRVSFQGGNAESFIGVCILGNAPLELRPIGTGFRPPVYEHYDSINAQGNAANYLGRSIKRKPMDLTIKQQGITQADLHGKWVTFLNHAARKPFFFSWDNENHPDEAVYCWTEKPQQPVYNSLCSASINLKVKAIKS